MIEKVKKLVFDVDIALGKYFVNLDNIFRKVYSIIDIPKMTLFDIVNSLNEHGIHSCDPKMISTIIEHKLSSYFTDVRCFQCGGKTHHNKVISRSVNTKFGEITFESPYHHCPKCKIYFEPYSRSLNLRQGKYQYDFQKVAAKIASSVPFSEASEILNDIYGVNIAPDAVHKLTNELGKEACLEEITPTPKVVQDIIDEISLGKRRRPVLVFTADGAMAPIRSAKGLPQCWKENKGVRVYLVDEDRIIHLLSWHQICAKKEFIEYLQTIKGLGFFPEDKVRVCCLGDGADWIWEGMNSIFPNACKILDYYHCSEHLHDFAKEKFGDTPEGHRWLEKTKERLFSNKGRLILPGLKRMKVKGKAEEKRDKLYNYLSKNIDRIDYGKFRRGGYPIGSGAIESANKFIGHVRLKRSGAWWKISSANNVLKLRCSRYNGKYDELFASYEKSQRKDWEPKKTDLSIVK